MVIDRETLMQRVRDMSPWFYNFNLGQGVAMPSKSSESNLPISQGVQTNHTQRALGIRFR